MSYVYTCGKCGASVTVDKSPNRYGCRRTADSAHTQHEWNMIGQTTPASTPSPRRESTDTRAGEELLQMLLRDMFAAITNPNLSTPVKLLILSPLLVLVGFILAIVKSALL